MSNFASQYGITWHNETRKVSELKPYEKNPRKIGDKEKLDLFESINRMDLADVIVIDTDNTIVSGHQRYYILMTMGRGEDIIDVRVPNRKLTDKEFQEYNIRANKNTGEDDRNILKENFEYRDLLEWGYKSEELDHFFEAQEDDFDEEEARGKVVQPKARVGDVYILGRHRLVCGDSTDRVHVQKLMNGEKAQLLFTHPPYNVNYKSESLGKIKNDKMEDDSYKAFLVQIALNAHESTTDDASLYWWLAMAKFNINYDAIIDGGWRYSQTIIWVKNNFVFSRGVDYHRMFEPCIFGWKRGKSHFRNKKIANYADVFSLDYKDFTESFDMWFERKDSTAEYVHPTQKPVRLSERAILKNTRINDIVLDMFGGSGSTLMACEQLQRRGFLMELSEQYVDVIISRWETFTGKTAIYVGNFIDKNI